MDTKAVVASGPDTILVAFRGTASWTNLAKDLQARCSHVAVSCKPRAAVCGASRVEANLVFKGRWSCLVHIRDLLRLSLCSVRCTCVGA